MNKRQESKLNMYNSVISFLGQNTTTVEKISALKNVYVAFKDAVASTETFSRNFELSLSGVTLDKKQLREDLARIASFVALNVYAYADGIGKNALKSMTDFTVPVLLKKSDRQLPSTCRDI